MHGVYTALITPFGSDGQIDLPAFKALLKDQMDAGITGVIPCGTTGEAPTLLTEEKKLLIETAIDVLKGSALKVIAGTGSNNTAESIALSKWASDRGAAAVLIVTPYFNKPSQDGLKLHFNAIADSINCELILYNVPGRTGISLTAATVKDLSQNPKINTLKEATGNVAFTSEILDTVATAGSKIDILSGDDATYMPLMAVGAEGIISVASNLIPRAMVQLQKEMQARNLKGALELHKKWYPLFRDLFVESNPVPIKAAMALAGFCNEKVRAPLSNLSQQSRSTLFETLKRYNLQKGTRL
ncbi:MAG: 4-hydroxy-tetrahydrodipicolinate synthase [Bdellovibrionota bacterium]